MRRVCVGNVLVDHGGICLTDPLYADITEDDNERICTARVGAPITCHEDENVGVYVVTGLGDGTYPCYVDVVDVPGAGERVARITIDCLGVEPESDDLPAGWSVRSARWPSTVSTCVWGRRDDVREVSR